MKRRILFLVLVPVGLWAAASFATALATDDPKTVAGMTSASDYSSVTLSFTTNAFTSSDGTGDLTAADFGLSGAGSTTISSVTKGANNQTWTLSFSAPVSPHTAVVSVLANQIYESDGTVFPAADHPVPLNTADLAAVLEGLQAIDLPLSNETASGAGDLPEVANLPLAGTWFENLVETAPGSGDFDATPRDLDDLLAGLDDLGDSVDDTQDALKAALEALPGVGIANFTGGGVTLTFDSASTSATRSLSGSAGVESLGLSLEGSANLGLKLDGALRVVASGGTATVDTSTTPFGVLLDASATMDAGAQLGFVGLRAPTLALGYSGARITVDLTCEPPATVLCAPASLTGTTADVTAGSASVDIPSLTLDPGTGTLQTFTAPSGNLLELDWASLTDLSVPPTISVNQLAGVANFNNFDSERLLGALQFLGAWLGEAENFGPLGDDLPIAGGQLGEWARVASRLGSKVQDVIGAAEDGATAQDLAALLCDNGLADDDADCGTNESPLSITTTAIQFDLDFDLTRTEGTTDEDLVAPKTIGLALADALDALQLSDVVGDLDVDATGALHLTLGADIRPDATLMTAFGLAADDFDDDGVANGSDPDADGDGLTDATDDDDDDGDNLPEAHLLDSGELCKVMAALTAMSSEAFSTANGHTTGTREENEAACDNEAAVGSSITFAPAGPEGEPAPTVDINDDGTDDTSPYTLTAADVCAIGALLHLTPDADAADPRAELLTRFRAYNGFADDTTCAAAVSTGTAAFNYDDAVVLGSPVQLAHRAYVVEATDPVLTAGLDFTGTDIGLQGVIGYLDIVLSGDVNLEPSAALRLVDPDTGANDSRLTFGELADAADNEALGSVAAITTTGPISAHFTLTNDQVFTDDLHLDVVGTLTALDNPGTMVEFHDTALEDATGLAPDLIHVGTDLGDFLSFEQINATHMRQLIRRFADRLIELGSSSLLDVEIPFTGVRAHEMVEFAEKWGKVAEQVLARDPQTISDYARALETALAANGMVTGVDFAIDGQDLTMGFDAATAVTRSYPFSFDLPLGLGDFISIAPADGGAALTAQAALDFAPTLGVNLAAIAGTFEPADLDAALYIEDPHLEFSAAFEADVFGTVHLGPVESGVEGSLDVDALVDIDVADGGDGRLTLEELRTGIASGALLDVDVSGPVDASLSVTNPEGTITVTGDLSDAGGLTITNDLDLNSLTLDIDTMVEGTVEATKFIGRMMARSADLNLDIPLLGDALQGVGDLGTKLQALAATIDALNNDPTVDNFEFIAGAEAAMNSALGCSSCASLEMVDSGGNPTTDLLEAEEILIGLDFGFHYQNASETVDDGFGIDDVFEIGLSFQSFVEYGYSTSLNLGFSKSEGFFLDAGPLLQLYAGLNATNIDGNVEIFGVDIASVTDGTAVINGGPGGLGPNGTAGGFRINIPQRLTLKDLSNRLSNVDQLFDPGFDFGIDIDLPLQTTSSLGDVPLPVLRAPVFFDWSISGFSPGTPSLRIGSETNQVNIDVSTIIGGCDPECSGLLAPIWKELGEYNPIAKDPIASVLNEEIPVLEKTILELANDLDVPFADVLQFLVSLNGEPPPGSATGQINLGWVEVLPTFQLHRNPTPWQCQAASLVTGLNDAFLGLINFPACGSSGAFVAGRSAALSAAMNPGTFKFGPLEVEIPLLDDPGKMLGLLLGPDVAPPFKLVEVRFGDGDVPFNVGIGVNFSATLFELNTGFLNGGLSVAFGGGLGVQFRLGVGYDTTGLRPGRSLLDGFYLVDFYNSVGADVQEISAGGFVAGKIDGHFGVLGDVASVRFRGSAGINLTAGLDFFDESPAIPANERGDGEFHLYEMAKVIEAHYIGSDNPGEFSADFLCIFRPGVDFSAFISFSGKAKVLGVTVFNESFSEEFVIIREYVECPLGVRIAQVVDGQLVLNGGPVYGQQRFDNLGDISEQFTLRRDGSEIVVNWIPAGAPYVELRFDVADIPRGVLADLGAGDDKVLTENDLGVPMSLSGGPGTDTLEGSNVNDVIDGGDGHDNLKSKGGDDILVGGDGNDTIDGGGGGDDLDGGPGNDTYKFANSWGVETLDDPTGTDTIDFFDMTTSLKGTSDFGDGLITDNPPGTNSLRYTEADIDVVKGGKAADDFTFKTSAPSGLVFDGQGGGDTTTVQLGAKTRRLNIQDTGSSGNDTIVVLGTAANDTFLLRGQPAGLNAGNVFGAVDRDGNDPDKATLGFVALLAAGQVDRINHANVIEFVTVEGGIGHDKFAFDDNVAMSRTTANGGPGDDHFQVGQIFGEARAIGHVHPDESTTDPDPPVVGPVAAEECRGTTTNFPPHLCVGLRDNTVGIGDASDYFGTRDTTRGFLSNGTTHPATLNGGEDNDTFQVYSNRDVLDLNGNNGDDIFIIRAFALEGSVSDVILQTLENQIGLDAGDGADYVEYAKNAKVNINGGAGFDTLIMVGTEFQDGILVDAGTARICPVLNLTNGTLNYAECANDIAYADIEAVGVQALGGNDLILVLSTNDDVQTKVFGGDHDDVIFFGRTPGASPPARGGDLTGIQGPVSVFGESDPTFDESIPPAIVLPGETAGDAEPPSPLAGGTNFGDAGIIDATLHTTGGTGTIDEVLEDNVQVLNLTGFGMGGPKVIEGRSLRGGVVFDAIDFVDARLGSGNDTLTVDGTHDLLRDVDLDGDEEDVPGFFDTTSVNSATPAKRVFGTVAGPEFRADIAPLRIQGGGGNDTVNLNLLDVATRVLGGDGDDVINVGSLMPAKPGELETMHALVEVLGGPPSASDTLNLDDSLEDEAQTVTVTQTTVTGLGLHPLGLVYGTIEHLDIDLGSADEVVNVQGTSAATTVHGNNGNERFYVSDEADLTTTTSTDHLQGTLDDIDGALTLDSEAGHHLLMASDEEATVGDTTGVITQTTIGGLSTGLITYLTSGSWADGVTVWSSQGDDTISFDGSHRSTDVQDVTTLNTNLGADVVTVDLRTADEDGLAVINGEEGDDTINGTTSTLGLSVFGSDGADVIDTGTGNDIVLGDLGNVRYGAADEIVTGGGGPGDRTNGAVLPVEEIESRELGTGAADDIGTGDGDDVVFAGTGDDTVDAGAGSDVVLGDTGVFGRLSPVPQYRSLGHTASVGGDDLVNAGPGADFVLGQHGFDTINGDAGADRLTGGHNLPAGLDTNDTVNGGADADVITGDNALNEVGRDVTLYEVELVGGPVWATNLHGPDTINGDAGTDIAFGQSDDDTMNGGLDDDILEGNSGRDTVFGGGHSDDLYGGGSAHDGVIDPGRNGTGLRDEGDVLIGDDRATAGSDANDGHDVILGDNGRIDRGAMLDPVSGATYAQRQLRTVVMADTAPGDTSGSDYLRGNGGDDDLYGQLDDGAASTLVNKGCVDGELLTKVEGDLVCGDAGDDGIVSDLGVIVSTKAEELSATAQHITTASPFIDEMIYVRGTVIRVTTLQLGVGGNDVVFGGDGVDAVHTGDGNDLANGGAGEDAMFGGNGNDALWGDVGHDRMYGGFGGDWLDVKPRQGIPGIVDDPPSWFVVSPGIDRDDDPLTTNESDTIYGGWDQDAMQADEGSAGPRPGDRLADWAGAYNAYYVCEGAYGAGRALREFSPNMVTVLQSLSAGDGAVDTATEGASGEVELALVAAKEVRLNTRPVHPDTPAHFTCEGED